MLQRSITDSAFNNGSSRTRSSTLSQEEEQKEEGGVPVCGTNLLSPVVDTANYINEVHYRIGNRMYIENAD